MTGDRGVIRRLGVLLAGVVLVIGLVTGLMATDGPLTNLMQLRGRTDENGYLRISVGTAGAVDGPLTAIANLRGRTDENGYLRVACSDCGGAPTSATYITQTSNATLTAEQALDALATGILRVDTADGVVTSLTDSAGIAANLSDETGTGALVFANSPTLTDDIDLGAAGVRLLGADGVLTMTGLGNGNDEDLTIDLDNAVANTVSVASGTGVTKMTLSAMSLDVGANFNAVGAGPHAIGLGADGSIQWNQGGTFASTSNEATGIRIATTLSVASSGGSMLMTDYRGTVNEFSSGNHPLLATLSIIPLTVVAGAATVTDTATVYINGATTATVSGANYALWATSGGIRFGALGAGTVNSDANGNLSSVSDERLKANIRPLPYGLTQVLALDPIAFRWTRASGMDPLGEYGGFGAAAVEAVMPMAVGRQDTRDPSQAQTRGFRTLSDRVILGATVNAIKELEARVRALESRTP